MSTLRTIGKYEIIDAIGTGGMGTVYRAYDPSLERLVAVKLLHLDRVGNLTVQEVAARFRNEARAVARLNHPAIVSIFDYDDQDESGAYIAMEYVNGCTLDDYVRQRPALHLEDAISAILQVLGGIDYAHNQGVIHRDIKPSNLLVTRDGMIKITDFGIAKIGPQNQTHTGLLVGTPQYMAPEQYMGGIVDRRCDVHAAGAVLYELLTGHAPFDGTAAEIMYKVCNVAPPAMSTLDASIPAAFDPVVAKALEKLPEHRYATAAHFQDALRSAWVAVASTPAATAMSDKARQIATMVRRAGQADASPSAGSRPAGIPTPPAGLRSDHGPSPFAPSSRNVGVPHQARSTAGAGAAATHSTSGTRATPAPLTDPTRPPGSLAAWSQEQLAEAERKLAPILGPMAKLLVRKAAANTANRQQLYEMLASHLHTPEEQRKFLESSALPPRHTNPHEGPAPTIPPQAGQMASITQETTERAGKLLARYLGPVAFVVVRKLARSAANESELYRQLAERVADESERARFLADVGRPGPASGP